MRNNGFTLMELMVTVLIIGVVVSISLMTSNGFIGKNKLNNAITSTKQLIQEAQSYAKTKSINMQVVFSSNGVTVQSEDGDSYNQYDFEDNVFYSPDNSTIDSEILTFNFKGSPLGSDGEIGTFTNSVNSITLCYSGDSSTCKYDKTILVAPLTGATSIEE